MFVRLAQMGGNHRGCRRRHENLSAVFSLSWGSRGSLKEAMVWEVTCSGQWDQGWFSTQVHILPTLCSGFQDSLELLGGGKQSLS